MRTSINKRFLLALFVMSLVLSPLFSQTANAGLTVSFHYNHRPADIRVWVDQVQHTTYGQHVGYDDSDVYGVADNVVLFVRASRSTYATVYVVDTEGFVHVVHPLSPYDNARLRGGRIYEFHLGELGLTTFGRGVAYAYAVSSPLPFDYSGYNADVFGCGYGYRVWGDPYMASRKFYTAIAGSCSPSLIGVSYARFYIGEYTRYPNYLCAGWHDDYGVRRVCRGNCTVYRSYRVHAADPYRVLHPEYRVKYDVSSSGDIVRHANKRVRYTIDDGPIAITPQRPVRTRTVKKLSSQSSSNKTVVRSSKSTVARLRADASTQRTQSQVKRTRVTSSKTLSSGRSKSNAGVEPARSVSKDAASSSAKTVKSSRSKSGNSPKATKNTSTRSNNKKKTSRSGSASGKTSRSQK